MEQVFEKVLFESLFLALTRGGRHQGRQMNFFSWTIKRDVPFFRKQFFALGKLQFCYISLYRIKGQNFYYWTQKIGLKIDFGRFSLFLPWEVLTFLRNKSIPFDLEVETFHATY